MHIWGIVSGCASCAVRLCVCEKSDGWLVAWGLCECMLMRSPMVWLLTFTVTSSSWLAGIPTDSLPAAAGWQGYLPVRPGCAAGSGGLAAVVPRWSRTVPVLCRHWKLAGRNHAAHAY